MASSCSRTLLQVVTASQSLSACSWVMQNEVPAELSGYEYDIFYAAYHLLIANDLLLTALRIGNAEFTALASYYYSQADKGLEWWIR